MARRQAGRPAKTPRPRKKPANAKKAAAAKRATKKKAAAKKRSAADQAVQTSSSQATKRGPSRPMDPSAADDAEARFIQPYQATKSYLCPGCNREIPAGVGHMVAVPPEEPDLRRHWHRGCWNNRHNLR